MINRYSFIKALLTAVLLMNSFVFVKAQNRVQQSSTFAPAQVKVDGELNEWNNQLPNFNKATNIFYAISNDEKNLYLSVQATDAITIRKIIGNGISFSVRGSSKDEDAVVTFPLLYNNTGNIFNVLKAKPEISNEVAAPSNQLSSLIKETNEQLIKQSKLIKVTGFAAINDTLISIYNENNVLVALRFTNKRALNYELSLPLAFIKSKINSESEIAFNIKLNGISTSKAEISPNGKALILSSYLPDGRLKKITLDATPEVLERLPNYTATDFKGKYTLAK